MRPVRKFAPFCLRHIEDRALNTIGSRSSLIYLLYKSCQRKFLNQLTFPTM